MKMYRLLINAAIVGSLGSAAFGQGFNSGSDGSRGDVVVSADTTIDLPPDGKLNFKSLTVNQGVRLRFNRNSLNTPVYVLAQADVIINGAVDVNGAQAPDNAPVGGKGGPGGFDGGKPGFGAEVPPG